MSLKVKTLKAKVNYLCTRKCHGWKYCIFGI